MKKFFLLVAASLMMASCAITKKVATWGHLNVFIYNSEFFYLRFCQTGDPCNLHD